MLGVIAFGIFLTVILALQGCYYLYRLLTLRKESARRFKERLGVWSQPQEEVSGRLVHKHVFSDVNWINEWIQEATWLKKHLRLDYLQTLHRQSGSSQPLARYVLGTAMLAMLGLFIGRQIRLGVPISMILGMLLGILPLAALYRMRAQRVLAFQRRMPEALELIARSLRAGHAFFVGVKITGEELADPVGGEFRRVYEDISVGLAVPEALERLLKRVECPEVKYFVTAVTVQRETGGNLAEIIEGLGVTIRKRFEFHAKVKAISAEGVLSAIIIFVLPFGMAFFEYTMSPDYMSLLWTDPIGKQMVSIAAVMMVIGAFVTRRLIDVKV